MVMICWRWFLNSYVQIFISSVLVTASEVLLKKGVNETIISQTHLLWWGWFYSGWIWLGIISYLGSFFGWLQALRSLPLNIAFNLASGVHILIPLGCWIFLDEKISLQRWFGILFVLLGIWTIAKPLVRIEERL